MYSRQRIASWLESTPPTPPHDDLPDYELPCSLPLKRKRRSMSMDSPASSPKRRRADDADDVRPDQSASQSGYDNPLSLHKTNTFDLPVSRLSSDLKRPASPTRETAVLLRSAIPPVLTEGLIGLEGPLPEQVEQLGDRLAEGLNDGFIPNGLQDIIKNDQEIGYQSIRSVDFDRYKPRPLEELLAIWRQVKNIFLKARACKDYVQDENAWCDNVVRPLLELAIILYGQGKWEIQNIQSQSINPTYLSMAPAPTKLHPARRKIIDRRADYCFSYSLRGSLASPFYKSLSAGIEIGHTLDTFTKRIALFSGLEVKAAFGDAFEAELQMGIWIAASLRKKWELAEAVFSESLLQQTSVVEPAVTVVGHEHSVYYAYRRGNLVRGNTGVHILGPDKDRLGHLSTESVRGIFRLARVYGNILQYGSDEGEHGYWGRFLGPILNHL